MTTYERDPQMERLMGGLGDVSAGISRLQDENNRMRSVLAELDDELDRQLYDDEHVRSMRNNDMDVHPDCEHHVIIREALRQKIASALASS